MDTIQEHTESHSHSTHVSRLTRMVQQIDSLAWSMKVKTPAVMVDHWMANEATNMLNAMLLYPYRRKNVMRKPKPINIMT